MLLKTISKHIIQLLDSIRYSDWHHMAATNIISALILLAITQKMMFHIIDLILYIIYIHIAFAFGFLINNFADRYIDTKTGKNYLQNLSNNELCIFLFVLLLGLVLIPLYYESIGITVTMLVWIFFGIFYSVKPFRFKEKGFFGTLIAVISQRLPFAIFFFLIPEAYLITSYLLGWLLLEGLLLEVSHQTLDYKNDRITGTHTFITTLNKTQIKNFLYYFTFLLLAYITLPLMTLNLTGVLLFLLLIFFSTTAFYAAQKHIDLLSQK